MTDDDDFDDIDELDTDWVDDAWDETDYALTSDDSPPDAVDLFDHDREQRVAQGVVKRLNGMKEYKSLFASPTTAPPKSETPLAKKDTTMSNYPMPGGQPAYQLQGPQMYRGVLSWYDPGTGQYFPVDSQPQQPTGYTNPNYSPQPTYSPAPGYPPQQMGYAQPQGYPPQGYPQGYSPQQTYPQPGYPQPPVPDIYMHGGPPPQGQPASALTGSSGVDRDRISALKRGDSNLATQDFTNVPMYDGVADADIPPTPSFNPAPTQYSSQYRVTSETMAIADIGGYANVGLAFNREALICVPLADVEGNLINVLVDKEYYVNKHNHVIDAADTFEVKEELANPAIEKEPAKVLEMVRLDLEITGTDLTTAIALGCAVSAENNYCWTQLSYQHLIRTVASVDPGKESQGDRVIDAIHEMEDVEYGEQDAVKWAEGFIALHGLMVNNHLIPAARMLNRRMTQFTQDLLQYGMGLDIWVDAGFVKDIEEIILYLEELEEYEAFSKIFMANVWSELDLAIEEVGAGNAKTDVVSITSHVNVVISPAEISSELPDDGQNHPFAKGLVTKKLTPELYEITRNIAASNLERKLYLIISDHRGEYVRLARSHGANPALDTFHILD